MNKIRELLRKVLAGDFSEADLETLIYDLATLLIPMIRTRQYQRIRNEGYEPRDIAFITLSTLFVRDAGGSFPVLNRIFSIFKDPKAAAQKGSFERYLYAILSRGLNQTFFALSNEIRPEEAKLRREFLYALKNRPDLAPMKIGGEVLFFPGKKAAGNNLKPMSLKELLKVGIEAKLWGFQVPKFLKQLEDKLAESSNAPPIRLVDAIAVYREINNLDRPLSPPSNDATDARAEGENLTARESGWLAEIEQDNRRILGKYIRKNKILPGEEEHYLAALREIISDRLDGRKEGSLFFYLNKCNRRLDPVSYRRRERKILEYLVRHSREFLKRKANEWRMSAK